MRKNIYNFAAEIEKYQKIFDETTDLELSGGSALNCYIERDSLQHYKNNFTDEIFKKATYYLNELEKKTNEPQYIADGCKYFCYWLHEEIIKEETLGFNILMLYQDILNGYEISTFNNKLPKYVKVNNENNIKNFRDMVDMYKNFHKFKNNTEESEANKCLFANKCVELYEKNIKVCKTGSDYDLCYELDNFRDEYNKHMEKNGQCCELPEILPSYRTYDTVVITSIPGVIILVACLLFFLYKVNKTYFLNI